MEKLIHKYLSLNYKLGLISDNSKKINLLDYDAIFNREDGEIAFGDKLVEELIDIFCEKEAHVKKYIESWAQSLKKYRVDLIWYWSQKEPWLPKLTEVVGRTIANDLVGVQPLSRPNSELFYLDFKHNVTQEINSIGECDIEKFNVSEENGVLTINIDVKPKIPMEYIEVNIPFGIIK